jgi:hypothetical protein
MNDVNIICDYVKELPEVTYELIVMQAKISNMRLHDFTVLLDVLPKVYEGFDCALSENEILKMFFQLCLIINSLALETDLV